FYDSTAEIEISWNAMGVSGVGTISGYNVYRRLADEQFDYSNPVNRTVIASSTYSFTDNHKNSRYAPVPNTVYYYEVRPIINGLPTEADENIKTIRVVAPPPNMVFIPRMIVNKTICEMMGKTSANHLVDSSNYYRCAYVAPGGTLSAATGYYDIGQDLLVDQFEAGCNYSRSDNCQGTTDHTCLGTKDPNDPASGVTGATTGLVYYNRSSGKCFINTAPSTWISMDTVTPIIMDDHNVPELPPLVGVTQGRSHTFCQSKGVLGSDILGWDPTASATGALPTRKQQIAYSMWMDQEKMGGSYDTGHDLMTDTEAGLSMTSVNPKCNSSNASGLDSYYTDVEAPDLSRWFTVPGTYSSLIRSMMTGGPYTKNCASRYGVQDAVGNVKEWISDRMMVETATYTDTVTASAYLISSLVGVSADYPSTAELHLTIIMICPHWEAPPLPRPLIAIALMICSNIVMAYTKGSAPVP
ncbi:MAG: hypothetical protein WCG27_04235, partial [Pseudomonadota bacterium]